MAPKKQQVDDLDFLEQFQAEKPAGEVPVNPKKKKTKKKKAADEDDTPTAPTPDPPVAKSKAKAKAKGKGAQAAKLLQERQRLMEEAERENQRLEEELRRQEEEEERLEAERLRLIAEAAQKVKDQKRAEKLKKREEEEARRKKKAQAIVVKPKRRPQKQEPVETTVEPVAPVAEASEENWETWLDEVDGTKEQLDLERRLAEETRLAAEKLQLEQEAAALRRREQQLMLEQVTDAKERKRIDEPRRHFEFNSKLRSPICCILGHVDTGKTKLLDKIRATNVQGHEAGGITQQIGATFFPREALERQVRKVDTEMPLELPGLLIIDTPGHESFNNLRDRGSSLCDIAILVIDIMHGLEPQTIESLNMLKAKKCPFIIALNKMDRLFSWQEVEWAPIRSSFALQQPAVNEEFQKRLDETMLQLNEQGMNVNLYYNNSDIRGTLNLVPTSAMTGEGVPDLLYNLCNLTQKMMAKSIAYSDEFRCTVLEVKHMQGMGCTIDVVLVQGTLREGDELVVCGLNTAIVTTVRALLTPQPLKEIREKGEYINHREIRAAMGVRVVAHGLENAVAGTSVLKRHPGDDLEQLQLDVMEDMTHIFGSVDRTGEGVYVMASTLGSLEALLQFLKDCKIPVNGVNLGACHKADVIKASTMIERGRPDLAVILAFDIKITEDAHNEAKAKDVTIFSADIIYHLFDSFTAFRKEVQEQRKAGNAAKAIFPCLVQILPNMIFNSRNPIVVGVSVNEGTLRVNTPLSVKSRDGGMYSLGIVSSIKHRDNKVDSAKKGQEVSISISGNTTATAGRHFNEGDVLCSAISRQSIDCLKEFFRDEMTKADWKLVVQLKKIFKIE